MNNKKWNKFTQLLNNPRSRELIEQIEETSEHSNDKYLKRINTDLKKQLKRDYDYRYL